jgi:hypothetical protein
MPVKNSREQDATERRMAGSGYAAPLPARTQPPAFRPVASRGNFVERRAAKLFSFDGVGEFLEGRLADCDQVVIQDKKTKMPKKVWQFTIFNRAERQGYKILGTADLVSKLSRDDVGSSVRITFIGVDNTVVKEGTPMKIFQVLIEERQRPQQSTEITDEDIPF